MIIRNASKVIALLTIVAFWGCKTKVPHVSHVQPLPVVSALPVTDTVEQPVAVKVPDSSALSKAEWSIITQFKMGDHNKWRHEKAIHYDLRKPNFVIIHHTAQNSVAQTIKTFQLDHTKVSSHYLIGRNGEIIQFLNDYVRAWHAGSSKWGSITDMNSGSVGIELDNNGSEPFSNAQIDSLIVVLDTLKTRYSIPDKNFLGHFDIAPTRKNDPSVLFPWKKLAQRGFGIWFDEGVLPPPPATFNYIDALKIIGYDTTNLKAAIIAFKRKFSGNDQSPVMTDLDKSILYNLYQKFY